MKIVIQSAAKGLLGMLALLAIYFGAVALISGWDFALSQFSSFWYFILLLAGGFGMQVGLYVYLRQKITQLKASSRMLAVTGTTSTAAMISCCSHYLVNILSILGVAGFISLISQYQIELFWIGLAFNAAGTIYMIKKVIVLNSAEL